MSNENDPQVMAGQAVYSMATLAVYDFWVLGVSNHLIWKCPTAHMLELYNKHISANHMDVGVGTGLLLDRCNMPVADPRIALVDLNPNSLACTARRISRYRPETYRRNVFEPLNLATDGFDSIGLNFLLHCLPGSIHDKAAVFEQINEYLNPGGTVFGSTLLQGGVKRGISAKALMALYNRKGIFSNTADDLDGLKQILQKHYHESHVEVIGCVALFTARK